ncbi:ABC transporter substrate-binding protein [Kosakonia sp. S42]|uniref:ABC transporter substrate-binding protein n=1 Tax=Kosakonia sp. S42 TaxID=2767458 RepID=UPI0019090956|nr:extracellular solute-binding protein [Kosakonia sp. S42]MBK0019006.1 extracellular solute-binding protein [Kosakonia sp. S42]
MKKRFAIAILTGAIALVCSSLQAAELTIMWYETDKNESTVLKELLSEYTQQHPETTFNLQLVPYDNVIQKFRQYAASGSGMPDISKTSSMEAVIRPYLVDFNQYFGKDYLDHYIKGWADGARLGDKAIAAPLYVTATGLLLNTDAFKKAGVALPDVNKGWTWEEFLPKIKEVSQKSGTRYPLVWDVSASRWIIHEYQYGNYLFSTEPPYKVVMDKQKAADTLASFVNIADEYMPQGQWSGASSDNPKELFIGGQAVAWMTGSWQLSSVAQRAKFDWRAGYTPKGTTRSSVYGGEYVVAFNTSKHLDETTRVVQWLTSPLILQRLAVPVGMIPATLSDKPVKYNTVKISQAMELMQHELVDSPTYAATDQANQAMQFVWAPIKDAVMQAVTHQITPEQAIDKIMKAGRDGLEAAK